MNGDETRVCPVCGEVFDIPPTRPKQIYCSISCAIEARQAAKLDQSGARVDKFIDSLPDLDILDALEGRMGAGTDNRITAKGARTWNRPGVRFIILAVEDRAED